MEKHTRRRVKEWVKENVSRRGEDGILWGRWNADNTGVMGKDEESPLPKEREPPTSRKQMRKLGEPPRKVQRRTNDLETEKITQNPPVKDAVCETDKDGVEPRQETAAQVSKQTQAQKREKRELRTKKRKEREENKKKKKKATEDKLKLQGNFEQLDSETGCGVPTVTQGREERNWLGCRQGREGTMENRSEPARSMGREP